jgi:TP901 family phage tail tape measure protein
MADRTVKVTLRANVTDFNQQIKQASRSLEDVVRQGDRTGKVADTGLGRFAQRATLMGAELTTVGTAAATFGAGLLAFSAAAVTTAANFDAAMSSVQASTHETADNMALLREAAIEAGAKTAFSATEAAAGIEELAKAGVSTTDILNGGLTGALDLAAAGGIGVAESAEATASALNQFSLSGQDATHVADLLAAGAGKAQGGVSDLSQALGNVGVVASSMGISIEETVGTLALFASKGLLGAEAGTALKSMLNQLRSPSKEAAATMDALGISAYDAQGNFVGLASLAGQLRTAMSGLSQEQRDAAMSTIFGSYAISAATMLYQGGAEAVTEWTAAVNDQGYAAETAAARMDNLKGDLEEFGGSVETFFIRMGESGQGPLRSLVQGATDVVNALGEMGPGAQTALLAVAGIGGVALTAAGTFLVLIPRIAEAKVAMQTLGLTSEAMSAQFGRIKDSARGISTGMKVAAVSVGLFLAAADATLGAVAEDFENVAASTETMVAAIKSGADANRLIETSFQGVSRATALMREGAGAAEDFGATLRYAADPGVINAFGQGIADFFGKGTSTDLGQIRAQFEKIGQALAGLDTQEAAAQFRSLWQAAGGSQEAAEQLLSVMPAYRNSLAQVAAAAGLAADDQTLLAIATGEVNPAALSAADGAGTAADAIEDAASEAENATEALDALVSALAELGSAFLDARAAARDYRAAVAEAWETLASGTATADDLEAALDGIASSALKLADALTEDAMKDGFISADELAGISAALQAGRDDVIAFAEAMGASSDEAAALADKMGLLPDQVSINVTADTSQAQAEVEAYTSGPPLANGSIQVSASLDEARENLMGMSQEVDSTTGTMTITGDTLAAQAQLAYAIGIIDNSNGTVTIQGDSGPVTVTKDSVKAEIDRTTGAVTITGRDNASNTIQTIRTNLNSLQDRTVTVTTYHKTIGSVMAKADGGAVYGPGTGTSDSIPAMLSNGEHVWTAAEVASVGGQARVYQLRALARAGMLSRGALGFAQGGSPSHLANVPAVTVNPSMPPVNLTVVVDNPLTGEQIKQVMTTVADGRIAYSNHLNR